MDFKRDLLHAIYYKMQEVKLNIYLFVNRI